MTRDDEKRFATVLPEPQLNEDSSSEPTVDRAAQARIGDHLRSMYNELMQQPVPDRFMDLLGRLDQVNGEERQ